MPRLLLYGDRLLPELKGSRQLVANLTTKAAVPPLQYDRYCRNGKHPSAHLWNQLNEATNQAVLYRSREIFRAEGFVGAGGGATSNGDRDRYRFAFHTSVYHHALMAVVVLVPQTAGLTGNAYSKLNIYSTTTESVTAASATFYHGVNPGGSLTPSEGLPYLKTLAIPITGLTPDTDYYAKMEDVDEGRVLACCVYELNSMTETVDGYLAQNITSQTEIFDVYRENVATIQKNLWKRSGGLALNFCADVAANFASNNTNTSKNVCDSFTTTISSETRGFSVDLRYRDRLSQSSGIPVVMKAFCQTAGATTTGRVYLKNSAGTAVMTITDGMSTTATWKSVTGFLPATADKYDLHFDNNGGGTLRVYAVSIYEYEA